MNEEGIKEKKLFNPSWPGLRLRKTSRQTIAGVFCLCVLFLSSCFYLLPVYSRHLLRCLPPSLPPSLNWLGGSSHDQACQPGNYLALSNKAATDSNEEWNIKERRCLCSDGSSARRRRRGDLRARGSCREAATTLSLPFLHKYHQCRQQSRTCPGSPERVYLYHTARLSVISCWYPWWWLQCNVNKRGSALLSDLAVMRFLLRVSPKVRGWKRMNPNVLWSCHECSGHPVLSCSSFIWISGFCRKKKKKIKRKIKVSVSNLDLNNPSTLINSDRNYFA